MFRGIIQWIKDWRHGWDVSDLKSAIEKMQNGDQRPGSITWLTHREFEALQYASRQGAFKIDKDANA